MYKSWVSSYWCWALFASVLLLLLQGNWGRAGAACILHMLHTTDCSFVSSPAYRFSVDRMSLNSLVTDSGGRLIDTGSGCTLLDLVHGRVFLEEGRAPLESGLWLALRLLADLPG